MDNESRNFRYGGRRGDQAVILAVGSFIAGIPRWHAHDLDPSA
jgi:hypothetical protein